MPIKIKEQSVEAASSRKLWSMEQKVAWIKMEFGMLGAVVSTSCPSTGEENGSIWN